MKSLLQRSLASGRIIGVLLLAVTLQACSAIKLSYNNAPELSYWWLDGYVDFTAEQKPRARDDLARLHDWHRSTELPRYLDLLQRAEQLVATDLTPAQACAITDEARARIGALAEQAEPAIVTLALTLMPEQLQNLEEKYAKNNEKFRKEWMRGTPSERRERRLKQVLERVEMVYGRLDATQRDAIRAGIDRSSFDAQRTLAERQRRQQETVEVLRRISTGNPSLAQARAQVHQMMQRMVTPPEADLRAYQQTLQQESCQTFAEMHRLATSAQREAAVRRLQGYQKDVRELASRAP